MATGVQLVVARIANCEGVSEQRPQDEAGQALKKKGARGYPDVVLLSEISWLNLAGLCADISDDLAGPDDRWYGLQHGTKGSPDAGVGIASRRPIAGLGMLVGSRATAEGDGIRMRPIVGGRTFGRPWWAVHPPPPRAPRARSTYVAATRRRGGFVGGDWNQAPDWMRRTSLRTYRGVGVLGLLIPRHIRTLPATTVDIGSDHPAVDIAIYLPVHKNRTRQENR